MIQNTIVGMTSATYDIILRYLVEELGLFRPTLGKYFKTHGTLRAAFVAFAIAFSTFSFINVLINAQLDMNTVIVTFIASSFAGILIDYSNILPTLSETYYSQHRSITMVLDGLSGILCILPLIMLQK